MISDEGTASQTAHSERFSALRDEKELPSAPDDASIQTGADEEVSEDVEEEK